MTRKSVAVEYRLPIVSEQNTSALQANPHAQKRKALATFVARTVEGERSEEIPYRPNDWTDTGWVVDRGNDWRVFFRDEEPHRLFISHRYRSFDAEHGLAHWIAHRTGGTVVLID